MKVMVVRSEDHTRIQNYRNEHNISDKNPEQLVPLETITIEVVSDRPLAPLVTSDRPLATPVTPKAFKRRGGQPEVTIAIQGIKEGYHPFKPFTPLSPEENFKDSLDADSSPPEPVNLCVQTINKSVTPEDSTSPLSCATIDNNNSMESIGDISLGTMKNLDQNPPWCSLEQEEDGVGLYCSP